MAETETQNTKGKSFAAHRTANIIVIVVASLAALVLIAIAVLCLVKVNPTDKLDRPKYYRLYDVGSSSALALNNEAQSRINVALGEMQFSVMSAILQGHWDYSYNFKRNSSDEKLELTGKEIKDLTAPSNEYMVEYVYAPVQIVDGKIDYSTAQSIEVDGETVYFDTVKIMVGDTDGNVGTISIYPYLSLRLENESDVEGIASDTYTATGINVRANTSSAFASLKELVNDLKIGVVV